MQGKQVQRLLFLAVFLFLFVFVARLFSPFFSILLWAGLLYVITFPLYDRATRRLRERRAGRFYSKIIAAAFSTVSILAVIVPLIFLGSALLGQARDLLRSLSDFLARNPDFFNRLDDGGLAARLRDMSGGLIDLSQLDVASQIAAAVNSGAERALSLSATLIRDAASFVVSLAFMVFVLYFFYVDGKDLILTFINAIPIENAYTAAFLRKFRDVGRHLTRGYLLVALYQGVAAFLIFLFFRVKGPLPLAMMTCVASFVPMLGTTLVWGPVGVARIISGDTTAGIAILALSFVLVSGVDNLLRPLLMKERIKMHPLLIFISIMGGLRLFGLNGLILGPMMLMLFFTGVELFEQAYGSRKPVPDKPRKKRRAERDKAAAGSAPDKPPKESSPQIGPESEAGE